MLEIFMEEVGCKRPISWKWSVEGMFFFHFQKALCHLDV
jgi:hypothetical protein